jgi:hypothetical protein
MEEGMPRDLHDAFGREIWDYYTSGDGYEIVERDDGFFGLSSGPKAYFSPYDDWSDSEKASFQYVRGRVEELVGILEGTGWHATDFIDGPEGIYIAIIDKG